MKTRRARLGAAFGAALFVSVSAITISAQQGLVPGQNINMVTGLKFPGGDPFLQKQNEGSMAVSTRNPCHLLAGANDYRAVNLPGLPADEETGDAWVGLYKSIDCGQTWFSTLVPGYPQDTSADGLASPVHGLPTGADPMVRSGPAGFFAYGFLAFNRANGVGRVALARFIDNNNKEAGDPIRYLDTGIWDTGSNGQFLDKPSLAVSAGTGTCALAGQTIPASTVHMAWTIFVGNDNNIHTKVYYAKSSNCGASLDGPATKLSEGNPINQGTSLAVSPDGKTVYVAWRQFATSKTTNAILFVKSTDGGNTFTKAAAVPLGGFQPFDQATTNVTFRTNAYPSIAFDQFGRLYLAVATRGYATQTLANQTRIVIMSTTDGVTWTPPQPVDPDVEDLGHQFMPALTYAGGKLNLIWYDFRDDAAGDAAKSDSFAAEIYPIRHTLDVRGAQAQARNDGALAWQTYGVLQLPGSGANTADRLSQYLLGNYGNSPIEQQLQHNPPNLRLYAGGTEPFFGDYIDIAGLPFIPSRVDGNETWVVNDGSIPTSGGTTFHAIWTDNRDVRPGPQPLEQAGVDGPPLGYAAPGATCTDPALTGTRNANIYTSRITPGVVVAAPGNAKSAIAGNGTPIQRAFPVMVQNNTDAERTFTLTIENQPPDPGGLASFAQKGALTTIDADIPAQSSVARTVYVTSSIALPQILVDVVEKGSSTPLSGSTLLNPDVQNPDIQNPDIQNPDIQNPDIQNAEVHNPDIQNPDIQNPDIQNPDIQNPDIQNPDIQNPDVQNPDIQNPDIQNPDIQNPDIQNPDIQNPDIQNGAVTDVSWDVTNDGNTTSAFQVQTSVGGDTSAFLFQLIGRRVYKTPAANGCQLTQAGQNQILFDINNPDLGPAGPGDPNDPSRRNATLLLAPGETVKVTLRAYDKDVLTGLGAPPDNGYQTFCPIVDTVGANCTTITNPTTIVVKAEAANTGARAPSRAISGPLPDLVVSSLTHSTPIAGTPMTFTAVVANTGGNTAAPSTLLFTIGGETPGAPGTLVPVPALAPGGTFSAQRTATLTPQSYVNTATADSDDVVTEANESNDTATDEFTVPAIGPRTLTVTTAADSGPGSLRQAILDANANAPAADTIAFALPAGAPPLIALQSALPPITDPLTIDTEPGVESCTASAPAVQINWIGPANGSSGFVVNAANTLIRGFSITGFGGAGVVVAGSAGDTVTCNYIGLDRSGNEAGNGEGIRVTAGTNHTIGGADSTAANFVSSNAGNGITIVAPAGSVLVNGNYVGTDTTLTNVVPNTGNGIQVIDSAGNTIGSLTAGVANVISANQGEGVRIDGALSTGNTIEGNFIGPSPSGHAGFGNQLSGVYIRNAPGNTVASNLISDNRGNAGVTICGAQSRCGGGDAGTQGNTADGNIVRGNRIGLDADNGAMGNNQGIAIDAATHTTIGGSNAGDGNVIAFNSFEGVLLQDNATDTLVRGNFIGTDATGNSRMGNGNDGVAVDGTNNVIGGDDVTGAAGNIIRNNGLAGITVTGGTGNRLRANTIDTNGGLAIDLGPTGVTANDAGDGDTGANDLQNAPSISSAIDGGTVTIMGSLASTPNSTFTIDVYASAACDDRGSGPGTHWIGSALVQTDGNGQATFTVTTTSPAPGTVVTATATSGDFVTSLTGTGDTSEFSNCATIVSAFGVPPAQ